MSVKRLSRQREGTRPHAVRLAAIHSLRDAAYDKSRFRDAVRFRLEDESDKVRRAAVSAMTAVEPEPILLHIRQSEGPEILTLVEAGQVGKIGLNSAGLGVCLNFLEHSDRGQGVPVHVILRQMLDCEALGDAVRAALCVPRGGAANILLAHAQGEILDLELSATDADFV